MSCWYYNRITLPLHPRIMASYYNKSNINASPYTNDRNNYSSNRRMSSSTTTATTKPNTRFQSLVGNIFSTIAGFSLTPRGISKQSIIPENNNIQTLSNNNSHVNSPNTSSASGNIRRSTSLKVSSINKRGNEYEQLYSKSSNNMITNNNTNNNTNSINDDRIRQSSKLTQNTVNNILNSKGNSNMTNNNSINWNY